MMTYKKRLDPPVHIFDEPEEPYHMKVIRNLMQENETLKKKIVVLETRLDLLGGDE
jgi:hypothetical protein